MMLRKLFVLFFREVKSALRDSMTLVILVMPVLLAIGIVLFAPGINDTTINFALPSQSVVTLKVYDILGQVVKTLYDNEMMEAGYQNVKWNGMNVASGLYIYRLNAKGSDGKEFVRSMKMMLLK